MSAPLDDGARWPLVERCFAAALDTPPESREAVLDAQCTDETVRRDVRRLLARHDALSGPGADGDRFLASLDVTRAARLVDDATAAPADPATIGRYEIVSRLGRGASGTVYLARDPLLGRPVAVKLLAAHLGADQSAMRRFVQEARAASELDHPHVITVYEIGATADDRPFIAMAYHEGETLRERLSSGEPMHVQHAVQVAAEIADGLSAAHARGIVHRDIKPENVLLTQSRGACIVDFGIAKVAGQTLTLTGAALGTAAYMSPEQTRGTSVDARSDLWSLGVVLYEMLTGVRPFRADGGEALVYGVRHDAPAPVATLRPDVPDAVAEIVRRCLAKDSRERFPSADALLRALRDSHSATSVRLPAAGRFGSRHAVAALVALAAAATVLLVIPWRGGRQRPMSSAIAASAAPRMTTIAVLPFTSEGPAAGERQYVARGIAPELIRRLASMADVRVAAPNSVAQLLRDSADIRTIGTRLGVAAVVRGSVHHAGDRVVVTAQLVRTSDGQALWSGTHDRPPDDVAAVTEEIRRAVIAAIGTGTADSAGRDRRRATADPVAYDLYLRGRFAYNRRTPVGLADAALYFREAIARDSSFARAYVGLADVYSATQSTLAAERFRRAKPLVARALAEDSMLSEAHRSAGWIAMWYDHDWATAERHLARALALDPSDIWAYHSYAAYLSAVGRTRESLALTRQATALDPVSSATATHIGLHLFWARRYDEAIAVLERALTVDTTWQRTHSVLGRVYLAAGRHAEAVALFRRTSYEYAAFEPEALLAYALGVTGQQNEARELVARFEARARAGDARPVDLVVVHLGLGDTARALDWAERIPDDRGSMFFLLSDPIYDPLRADPRFQRVIDRLGLGAAAREMAAARATRVRAGNAR